MLTRIKYLDTTLGFLLLQFFCATTIAKLGFVTLPTELSGNQSAYVQCNPMGNYGLTKASAPSDDYYNACAVSAAALLESPLNAPLEGFRLIGVMVSDVEMPKPEVGRRPDVAVLTDAIWRNKENTECIFGTHLQMKDSPLASGQYWEVNDIARAGFAGKDISIAYFYKLPAPEIGGGAEVLFRAGRTFTSVKTNMNEKKLPSLENAPAKNMPINENNTAAYSENWVNFTTDLSFKDDDGVTRANSSIFYIKYACDARDPVSKPDAIRFRTTGQNGKKMMEISAPALVPVDAQVEQY